MEKKELAEIQKHNEHQLKYLDAFMKAFTKHFLNDGKEGAG